MIGKWSTQFELVDEGSGEGTGRGLPCDATQLHRTIAIKELRSELAGSPEYVACSHTRLEACPTGSLEHHG